MPDAKQGIVYVLINPAMPGLVKIGQTSNEIASRLRELHTTGVPLPFECLYACEVSDCGQVEDALHEAFDPYRINPKREFFAIKPDQAIAILRLLGSGKGKDVTTAVSAEIDKTVSALEKDASKSYKKKRPPLNFTEMGIPIGAKLVFAKDESVEVYVSSDKKVKAADDDEEKSLTKVTREILQVDYDVQPTRHWSHEGKSLNDYYNETYTFVD